LSLYEVSRQVLPHVLNERGLTGQGVEVGVCEGHFSECILANWPGILYLVDPWSALKDYQEHYDHEETYRACMKRLRPYIPRFKILRTTSLEAAQAFGEGSLDFVYLDARHDYRGVSEDLEAWYPKLKVGGLFAGDDYGPNPETLVDFGHGRVSFGVKRAVDEFALAHAKNVSIDWLAQWSVKDADGSEQMARNWWMIR